MPRYRIEIVWVSRYHAEVETDASSPDTARAWALDLLDTQALPLEIREDTDPEVEINVSQLSTDPPSACITFVTFVPITGSPASPWPE